MIPKALSDEKSGEYQVVLFEKTNIQFLDFDLNISAETFSSGNLYTVVSYTDPKDQSEKFTRHLVRKEKEGYRDLFFFFFFLFLGTKIFFFVLFFDFFFCSCLFL